MTEPIKYVLCEKENAVIFFGICIICHLKIDDAMSYYTAQNTNNQYLKNNSKRNKK